jgi:hypothetical protein
MSRRTLAVVLVPVALAVSGGAGIAAAASGGDGTATTPGSTKPGASTTPRSTPAPNRAHHHCPHMGGDTSTQAPAALSPV